MHRLSLPSDLERLFITLCDELATPLSSEASRLCKEKRWDELVSKRVDPLAYSDHRSYFRDAAALSFLRKCKDIPTSFDRKAVAVENYKKSELQCKSTNQRLQVHFLESSLDRLDGSGLASEVACARLVAEARKEARRILGKAPSDLMGRFGPGATFGDKGRYTTVPDKMSSQPTLTSRATSMITMWSETLWAKAVSSRDGVIQCVRGNRFTTVPKDCTKDRGIAVEPSINLFFQLAVGRAMRKALLRRANINLTEGQAIHRQVARDASLHGCYATLDLSNASDTVSKELVRLLIPHDWYQILSELRSPFTFAEGKWWKLEKFSSMGNGFTFELETVIFLSIISAVRNLRRDHSQKWEGYFQPGKDYWVYGDDLIIPTHWAEDVIAALSYLGFSINKEKSFFGADDPFRESCGGDFFKGVDVRPYFLKEFPYEPQHWIRIANGIRTLAHRDCDPRFGVGNLVRSWFCCLDVLPSDIRRIRGPEWLGDLVIQDSDSSRWNFKFRRVQGRTQRYIRVYKPASFRVIGWEHFRPEVVLASACYGAGEGKQGVSPRDNVTGFAASWVPYSTASSMWLPA